MATTPLVCWRIMTMSDVKYKTSFNDDNRFYILGEFTDEFKENIVVPLTKKINDLSKTRDAKIEIYISSEGGDGFLVTHLIELLELAKAKDIKVATIVTSHAFSAASMLAIAGTEGERYISPMAEHLVHYGQINMGRESTPLQIDRQTDYKKRWFNIVLNHYKKYSNVPNLAEHLKDDNFFINANDCIKYKLADKLIKDFYA